MRPVAAIGDDPQPADSSQLFFVLVFPILPVALLALWFALPTHSALAAAALSALTAALAALTALTLTLTTLTALPLAALSTVLPALAFVLSWHLVPPRKKVTALHECNADAAIKVPGIESSSITAVFQQIAVLLVSNRVQYFCIAANRSGRRWRTEHVGRTEL